MIRTEGLELPEGTIADVLDTINTLGSHRINFLCKISEVNLKLKLHIYSRIKGTHMN